MKTSRKLIAVPAIALAAGISLTACGGTAHHAPGTSASTAQAAPVATVAAPTADSTLTGDGYRVVTDKTPAQIAAIGGTAAPYITSVAMGWTRNLSKAEVVIVISPAGVQLIGDTGAVQAALQRNAKSGETVTVTNAPNGSDVIREIGPVG